MAQVHNYSKLCNENEELLEEHTTEMNDLYYEKTMRTMEVLMSQINLMYYCEKIRLDLADKVPTLD